ncbi:MAG TPA: DCC1-like thiol-disulfide oxidoreductase family protein [Kofleriaceae bacterium]|jgi:predicted DCC family thiol-disulfide oxidoreductase YuxK|nr:DCC1-like thiol-disulfide oxidoreductase family protein [Kofleriaceae bacterium]
MPADPERIVLYDGVCGLCNRAVAFLIARDGGQFRYAQLQGETAARLRVRFPDIPERIDTIVFVDGDRAYLRSKAALHIARYLPRPWRWLAPLRVLPAFLIDLPYRLIARVRYRIWGKVDACRLPAPGEAARLLP